MVKLGARNLIIIEVQEYVTSYVHRHFAERVVISSAFSGIFA